MRADGAEGVEGLTLHACAHHGARGMGCQTAPGRAQQPETPLVLEHRPHRAAQLGRAQDLAAYLTTQLS